MSSQNIVGTDRREWVTPIILIRRWLGFTIPETALALFFDGMNVLLCSGRSVADILQNEAAYGFDLELRGLCTMIAPQVRNGQSLCDCLRPYETRFPRIVLCLLEVGEVTGDMASAARQLADTFQQATSMERQFKIRVYDPRLFFLAFGLITLVQQIIGALSTPVLDRSLWDGVLSVIVSTAASVLTLTALYLVGRMTLKQVYRWYALQVIVDTIKLALPRLGSISRDLSTARWARSFAALWAAGVPISAALEASAASALNAHYERTLRLAALQTRQGRSLSDCLAHTALLPFYLMSIIAACEMSGCLDNGLVKMAEEMEKDALARANAEMNKLVVAAYILLLLISIGGGSR